MGLAAFNRMRRELAEREAKEAEVVNTSEDEKKPAEGENESREADLDELDIEEVKARLEELEIKFAHNTSEKKLREKLKDAIS